jgi:hypothetical protein
VALGHAFWGFLAIAPLFEGNIPSLLRGFVVFYKIVMWSSLALFCYFFAVFPASFPIDRKVPWVKYVLLATAIIITVPIGFRCLVAGGTLPLYLDLHWPGTSVISLVCQRMLKFGEKRISWCGAPSLASRLYA